MWQNQQTSASEALLHKLSTKIFFWVKTRSMYNVKRKTAIITTTKSGNKHFFSCQLSQGYAKSLFLLTPYVVLGYEFE